MTNYRQHLPKFKKKIALLLREVLKESQEFAEAFTANIDRSSRVKKVTHLDEPAAEFVAKVYEEDTEEFKQALEKIPPHLLDLFANQLRAKATALISGGIVEEKSASPAEDISIEDSFGDSIAYVEEDD